MTESISCLSLSQEMCRVFGVDASTCISSPGEQNRCKMTLQRKEKTLLDNGVQKKWGLTLQSNVAFYLPYKFSVKKVLELVFYFRKFSEA
jgi:hypothetical protein